MPQGGLYLSRPPHNFGTSASFPPVVVPWQKPKSTSFELVWRLGGERRTKPGVSGGSRRQSSVACQDADRISLGNTLPTEYSRLASSPSWWSWLSHGYLRYLLFPALICGDIEVAISVRQVTRGTVACPAQQDCSPMTPSAHTSMIT